MNLKLIVKNYLFKKYNVPTFKHSLSRLHRLGYTPKIVFDIGAYHGEFTHMIGEIWQNSKVYLFEPQESCRKFLNQYLITEENKLIHFLLGDINDESVDFFECETASSVLKEHKANSFNKRSIPMRTLDYLIDNKICEIPNLVKIDTQGFEYEILVGFSKYISYVDIFILELNVLDIHENVKMADSIIHLMKQNGFSIYDIVEIHRRPLDNALWQFDVMFVKEDSYLRLNKSWSND
jgi:FkbM family methyltransferase